MVEKRILIVSLLNRLLRDPHLFDKRDPLQLSRLKFLFEEAVDIFSSSEEGLYPLYLQRLCELLVTLSKWDAGAMMRFSNPAVQDRIAQLATVERLCSDLVQGAGFSHSFLANAVAESKYGIVVQETPHLCPKNLISKRKYIVVASFT